MTDNSNNNIDSHPTNLVQFESQEVKHKFGLDKYPDVPTERLLVSLKSILKTMATDPPSNSRLTDIQFMALEYWAEMCLEELATRITALHNRIDR